MESLARSFISRTMRGSQISARVLKASAQNKRAARGFSSPMFGKGPLSAQSSIWKSSKMNNMIRRYSSATVAGTAIPMTIENGNYKVPLPLPSRGTRVFSLHETKEVVTFLLDVLAEDPEVKDVSVHTTSGDRIARSTPVVDLLRADWVVKVNGDSFHIRSPPRSTVGNHYVPVKQELLDNQSFKKIQAMFDEKAKTHDSIQFSEYLQFAEDLGIQGEQAAEIARALHKMGAILHFNDNPELAASILLRPREIATQVEQALNLGKLSETRAQLAAQITELEAQLAVLNVKRESLLQRSARLVDVVAWSVLIGLLAQFALFARLTWWESSWDVMEPVTWITNSVETIIFAYFYYLFTKKEYSNNDLRTILIRKRFNSLARSTGFDEKHYEQLKEQLTRAHAELRLMHDE